MSVTTATERLAARASRTASRMAVFMSRARHRPGPCPAGEADVTGLFVADAEVEQLRLAGLDDVDRFEDDRTFDAAAGDGALEGAGLVDDELAADGAGRRAPGGDDGGERHTLAGAAPRGGLLQDLVLLDRKSTRLNSSH